MTYWVSGSLVPFDDQQVRHIPVEMSSSNPAMDTTKFDAFRQGVELRRTSDLFQSSQPKVWGGRITPSGTITHEQDYNTLGQAVSFSEFFNDHTFAERPKFDPTSYIILGNDYPRPIVMNGGPQTQQEAIIETLTIPFRLSDIEGVDVARTVRAELLGGNHLDGRRAGDSQAEQFAEVRAPSVVRPWLELGEQRFGTLTTGSVYVPGYLPKEQRLLTAWTEDNDVVPQIAYDTTMSGSLNALKFGVGPELRPRGKRSATAGTVVYGPQAARAGTDSITFAGMVRGS